MMLPKNRDSLPRQALVSAGRVAQLVEEAWWLPELEAVALPVVELLPELPLPPVPEQAREGRTAQWLELAQLAQVLAPLQLLVMGPCHAGAWQCGASATRGVHEEACHLR